LFKEISSQRQFASGLVRTAGDKSKKRIPAPGGGNGGNIYFTLHFIFEYNDDFCSNRFNLRVVDFINHSFYVSSELFYILMKML
jgi:hypothetical protein